MPEQFSSDFFWTPPKETHGLSKTKEYKTWTRMKGRCHNPNDPGYAYYGGRGIKVCDRWRRSFAAFYADMGARPAGTSIDRIDTNGNYEPDNCRWADKSTQMKNRRNAVMLTFNGKTQNMIVWAREIGVGWKMIQHRLDRGWSVEASLRTPALKTWSRRRPATRMP